MSLEPDIVERIKAEFGPEAPRAVERLERAGLKGRLARCAVVAARGKLERLEHAVALAAMDPRDLILAGEYDEKTRHVRELSVSFLVGSQFWIGEVGRMMVQHGYALSAIEPRAATLGPWEYRSDEGEGVATFDGPLGSIFIEKRDRRWTLRGDAAELTLYNLDHPHDDERAFMHQVSSYLLTKQYPPGV